MATNNATNTSNPITVAQGGTGVASATAYAVLCGGTTSTGALQSIASVGSSGNVLTSNGAGALPTFQSASSGSLVLVQSQTASSSATISFTGLSPAGTYLCVIRDVQPATNGSSLRMLVSLDGSSYLTAGYTCGVNYHAYNSTTLTNSNATTAAVLSGPIASTGTYGGSVVLPDVGSAAQIQLSGTASWNDSTLGTSAFGIFGGSTPSGIVAIRFQMSAGNITIGTFALYRYASS